MVVNSMDWLRVRAHLERGLIPSSSSSLPGDPPDTNNTDNLEEETFRRRGRRRAESRTRTGD